VLEKTIYPFKIYTEFNKKCACTIETAANNLCNERVGVPFLWRQTKPCLFSKYFPKHSVKTRWWSFSC